MFGMKRETVFPVAALLLGAVLLAGCGGGVPTPKATEPKKAVATLQAALEKWKSGATIEALQKENPAVYAGDEDWQAGAKLVAFELRDVVDPGAHTPRIPVRLNIQASNDLQLWKEVEYLVTVTDTVVNIQKQDAPD